MSYGYVYVAHIAMGADYNPFIMDSKAPNTDEYKNFLMGEVRYNALARQNPERAERLFDKALENAKDRYDYLLRLSKLYGEA